MLKWVSIGAALALALAGCATDEYGNRRPMSNAEKGVLIGVAGGAILGTTAKNKKKGVLIGAVGGGIAGGLVGTYMDNQKKDLEKALAKERDAGAVDVAKLDNNIVRVTMTDQTAFEVDSAEIKAGFRPSMDKIAAIVNRYGKTHLMVVGHTDNTGSDQHNQALSERRAQSVQQYFTEKGVIPQRLAAAGKGEAEPRASNASVDGRRLNRRVEIFIDPIVAEDRRG